MTERVYTRIVCLPSMFFFFQAEDGIRDWSVTGVQTSALPISGSRSRVTVDGGAGRLSLRARISPGSVSDSNGRLPVKISYRSEERRVGKECRSQWSEWYDKRKKSM